MTQQGLIAVLGRQFPFGTLAVNVLGSFLIGLLFVAFWERAVANELLKLALVVGFLGSFTTFSAFSLDTWILVQHGAFVKAAGNVLANVTICLFATWLGIVLARMVQ
jgi:CrcB protein